MVYRKALQYLNSFTNYEQKNSYSCQESFSLESVRNFLKLLGNPQDSLKFLHIAGTKGKGSTCAFVASILKEAGFKVGLYTSPHLSDLRERIRILNPNPVHLRGGQGDFAGMISNRELVKLVEKIKPLAPSLSFFEVWTALAFLYFKEKKTDFVVLETGLGGRLDATNVVSALVCGITPISFDHTQFLGKTLKKITGEKAGIIKSGLGIRDLGFVKNNFRTPNPEPRTPIIISAPQELSAREVIRGRCRRVGARLYEVGKQIKVTSHKSPNINKNRFSVQGILEDYPGLKTRLVGRHQLVNATTAIGMVEALSFYGVKITRDSIKKGIYNTFWPGRCEMVASRPLVVLDGAQNRASAEALKIAVKENFKYKKLILVLGISADKDIKGIAEELVPLADTIILTQANNPRAASSENLECEVRSTECGVPDEIFKTKSAGEAKNLALQIANKEDLILVTGSLFVVGEMRELFT